MKQLSYSLLLLFLIACGNTTPQTVVQQAPIVYATSESGERRSISAQVAVPDREPPYFATIKVNFTPVYRDSTGDDAFQLLRTGDTVEVIAYQDGRSQIKTSDYEGWIEHDRVTINE